MKICTTCGKPLSLDEFYDSPCTSDGKYGDCKECFKEKRRVNYKAQQTRDDEHASARFIARHRAGREQERLIETELRRIEGRDYIEPRSFAGLVDKFFRSQRQHFQWRAV